MEAVKESRALLGVFEASVIVPTILTSVGESGHPP